MTTTNKLVTAEELLGMAGSKYLELYDGELRTASPANMQHGSIAVQIAMLLQMYAGPRKLGRAVVEGGYVLKRNPDTVLGPDVSFVVQARIPVGGFLAKFFEGCPDLAVEIISPTNPRREILEKMRRYQESGTALGWLADPVAETVEIFRPQGNVEKLGKNDVISGEAVVAGFSCAVAEFFA